MKRGKNEKVWFCLEAGWKIWYDYGKAAGPEEENRRAKNKKNRCKGEEKKHQREAERNGGNAVCSDSLSYKDAIHNIVQCAGDHSHNGRAGKTS